jgi:glycerol-3-phosphate acyltransferase PlsX
VRDYTIAIDVMGGDYGPEVALPAALMALQQHSTLSLILVGDEALIQKHLDMIGIHPDQDRYAIHHASQRIEMDESPVVALRHKTDSSMRVALELVKQGQAHACVSAGNTGALMAIARFVLKTLPGIDRPAISALLPTQNPHQTVRMLDLGANVDIQVEHLLQFAVMGLVLAKEVDNVPQPKLALLNIGTEAGKGNRLLREAAELFEKEAEALHYSGFIEGHTLFQGEADVVICDGFTGNIALKVMEGVAKLISQHIQNSFNQHWFARLAGFSAKPFLKEAISQLEPNRYNGASLVGLQGIAIKSHGSADAQAFYYAIRNAMSEIDKAVPERIQEQVSHLLQKPFTL